MPLLFRNKFSPKKGLPRKSASLSNLNIDQIDKQTDSAADYGPVTLKLGGNEMKFDGGSWLSETSGDTTIKKEAVRLRKENKSIQEENNLLKFKIELLLDMLARKTAEMQIQDTELEQLRKMMKKK